MVDYDDIDFEDKMSVDWSARPNGSLGIQLRGGIMTDADCPNCGADNLTDYPVCQECAKTCHFPHRASVGKICIHCQTKEETNGDN